MKQFLLVSSAIFLLFCSAIAIASDRLRLGVVCTADDSLLVQFIGEETLAKHQRASMFGGLIGAAISGGGIARRNERLAQRLNESSTPIENRAERLLVALNTQFSASAPGLELVLLSTNVLKEGEPDFKALREQDVNSVLTLSEQAGLATPLGGDGQLAGFVKVTARLYQSGNKRPIYKQTLDATGRATDDIDLALDSPTFFTDQYDEVANAFAIRLYRHMSGRDAFHKVAKGTPVEDQFPSVKAFLAKQGKLFKLERAKPKGWQFPRSGTAYLFNAIPRKDKKKFGMSTEIDLLAQELGQDFASSEDYFAYYFGNLGELGFAIDQASELPDLGLNDDWSGYRIPDTRGGWRFVVHKLVGRRALIHHIVVLEEDPSPMLEKYRGEIVSLIDGAKLVDR